MTSTTLREIEISPKTQGLIFDLDGTLLDSIGVHWQAWQMACREYDTEIDFDFFIGHTGKPIEKIAQIIIDKYNIPASTEAILDHKERLVYANLDGVKPIEAVVNVAKKYFGKLPMTVGTGSDRRRAEIMLERAGLQHLFSALVCSEDVVNHKPSPDTFFKCAEIMGIEPQFCQVFEDGEPGLLAAKTAKMIATDIRPYYQQ